MTIDELQYLLGIFGTVAFAVTAVLAVTDRGIDLYGACVMGLITAIGGGTIRDVILNVPVFWSLDLNYIWVALLTSIGAFLFNRFVARKCIYRLMLYVDALGVSLFSIQATHKVYFMYFGMPLGPVLLGVITAIGGGLVRDVLAGNPNLLMSKEVYAMPVTLGCILYVVLIPMLPGYDVLIGLSCTILIFALRAVVIFWDIRVPIWMTTHADQG